MKPAHVHFRLSHEAWVRYSSQAQAHEMALGTWLRLRLEQQDEFLAGELAAIVRDGLERIGAERPSQDRLEDRAPFPPQ